MAKILEILWEHVVRPITLVGEPLMGVDGTTSTSIEGLPVLSAVEELKLIAAE